MRGMEKIVIRIGARHTRNTFVSKLHDDRPTDRANNKHDIASCLRPTFYVTFSASLYTPSVMHRTACRLICARESSSFVANFNIPHANNMPRAPRVDAARPTVAHQREKRRRPMRQQQQRISCTNVTQQFRNRDGGQIKADRETLIGLKFWSQHARTNWNSRP